LQFEGSGFRVGSGKIVSQNKPGCGFREGSGKIVSQNKHRVVVSVMAPAKL